MFRLTSYLTLLVLATLCLPPVLDACAVAPREGERVEMADESAIIIWDNASKVQHFIRRASFNKTAEVKDFGFLVPTPSYPELAEAGDEAFETLRKLTEPRTVTESEPINLIPIGCPSAGLKKDSDVQVLHEQRVAGYDAKVLEVKKASALSKWLADHGYEFGADLKDWAAPYVARGWKITAFKVARGEKGERLATSAVRMTFPADRPFFPYREPAAQPHAEHRRLRVYLVAEARYQGVLDGAAWQARYSDQVDAEGRATVLKQLKLPADTAPEQWRLTEFEDTSSKRQGKDDVYFEKSGDQSKLERRPHIVYVDPGPLDYVLAFLVQCSCCYGPVLLLAVGWGIWRWRKKSGGRVA